MAQAIKRLMDVAAALAGLVILSPLLSIAAAAIWLTMGPPVLFRQPRPGLRGRPFILLKFRTMTDARDVNGELLPDAERLTGVGKLLRMLSIDELPQLWNVLRGEMSLVGPRPLLMEYLERYTPQQMRRHEVKPGITGWAQVNGRNAITWEQKFEYDVWYVDNWSLGLDLKILLFTIWNVLRAIGISQPGQATMEEFQGTRLSTGTMQGKREG